MPQQPTLAVSKSNLIWLGLILLIGAVAWVVGGWLAGVGAGAVVLLVSEVVERRRRARRRSAS